MTHTSSRGEVVPESDPDADDGAPDRSGSPLGALTTRAQGPAIVGAVTAGAVTAWVLVADLGRSFNFDESVNVSEVISRGSAWYALTGYTTLNNHPVFGMVQSAWWGWGGDGEARQRLLPILYGVLAVALLTWWVSRRLGLLAGICAAAVLVGNPMFVGQARSVRGYSLVVLAVVVSTIALVEWVERQHPRLLIPYVLAVVVALGTHLFAGVPLGAVAVAAVVARRRLDVDLVAAWLVAAGGTLLIYLPVFEELRESVGDKGSRYIPWAARTTAEELLGASQVTVALLGATITLALVLMILDERLRWPSLVVVGLVVGQFVLLWQVIRPFDFFPRFFIGVLPLIALGVAVAVRRIPALAVVVLAATVFAAAGVQDERTRNVPIRETAQVIEAARAQELTPCIVGGGPVALYAPPPREVSPGGSSPTDVLEGCDVFIRIGGWGAPLLGPARDRYAFEARIDDAFEIFADVPLEQFGPMITRQRTLG